MVEAAAVAGTIDGLVGLAAHYHGMAFLQHQYLALSELPKAKNLSCNKDLTLVMGIAANKNTPFC